MWAELWQYLGSSIFGGREENQINFFIFWALLTICAVALLSHMIAIIRSPKLISIAPVLLTGIGILGTFLGIFLGLYEFEADNIKGSVEELLDGLKIAFVTSILGMGFAIALRVFMLVIDFFKWLGALIKRFFVGRGSDGDKKHPKTAEDFMLMVEDIKDSVNGLAEKNDVHFSKIVDAIGGDNDTSLLSTINKLRMDSNDNHKEMKKEFQDFAEKVSDIGSKALIEALEEVVRDFNEKISDQFGENFKQLNEAVGSLLEWQKEYKEHLELLEARFQLYLDNLQAVDVAVGSIKESADGIPVAMDKLSAIIESAESELEKLHGGLVAFAEMKDQALESFPVIEENLRKLSSGLGEHADALGKTLEAQQASHAEIQGAYSGLSEQTQDVVREFTGNMREALEGQQTQLQGLAEQFSEQLKQEISTSTREMQESVKQGVEHAINELKDKFGVFDDEMEQQLQKVIEEMGSHLASLSEKFVNDYTPLTEQLKDLLDYFTGPMVKVLEQAKRDIDEAE